jgi:type IV secretory pathway protease TraF
LDTNITKPGDLVVYDLTQVDISDRQNGNPVVFRATGVRISRQVAQAGQVVSWKNGKLFVDGMECFWQPGRFMAEVADFEVIVQEDSIFVMLEGILAGDNHTGRFDIGRFGVIPKRNVIGRVFLRSFPWTSIRWY